ncbi:SPOR domain-containing protein [Thiomicrorhabdus sp. 6S3-12]|uniref:SPOR domain-containing protein n=1 Tax=Thiomicrorhabdus sp. 6S3-12 TaxID=2819681 RepID=UPI001AADB99E|nr:SPOR domain-containing protein [Thiomicrorhabdus sp. 6S3-12]MBO1924748.1 SPOR domain-containing protein [Thiomicrorhabdus sp. 6S3-12]
MARDYRPRRSPETLPPPMLESSSARHKRQEEQRTSRNAWLVMLLVIGAMVGGYWVINHFANSGLKSGSQQMQQQAVAEVDSTGESESVVILSDPQPEALEERIELPEANTPLQAPEAVALSETEVIPEAPKEIRAQALEVPSDEQIYGEPKKNFYSELKDLEVIPDDTTPEPVALEKPKYILAGSFFSESAALRAQSRLAQHEQKLKIRSTVRKDGKHIYALYTEPYYDRLELNKRKNQLRKLGASVMELEYKSESR